MERRKLKGSRTAPPPRLEVRSLRCEGFFIRPGGWKWNSPRQHAGGHMSVTLDRALGCKLMKAWRRRADAAVLVSPPLACSSLPPRSGPRFLYFSYFFSCHASVMSPLHQSLFTGVTEPFWGCVTVISSGGRGAAVSTPVLGHN